MNKPLCTYYLLYMMEVWLHTTLYHVQIIVLTRYQPTETLTVVDTASSF